MLEFAVRSSRSFCLVALNASSYSVTARAQPAQNNIPLSQHNVAPSGTAATLANALSNRPAETQHLRLSSSFVDACSAVHCQHISHTPNIQPQTNYYYSAGGLHATHDAVSSTTLTLTQPAYSGDQQPHTV